MRAELETTGKLFGSELNTEGVDPELEQPLKVIRTGLQRKEYFGWGILLTWVVTRQLDALQAGAETRPGTTIHGWLDELMLKKIIRNAFRAAGYDENQAWRSVVLLSCLLHFHSWLPDMSDIQAAALLETWLNDEEIRKFLAVNRYQDVLWYNKEALEMLLWGFTSTAATTLLAGAEPATESKNKKRFLKIWKEIKRIEQAIEPSGYQVEGCSSSSSG